MFQKPLRILHCPSAVGGNPQGLARAERRLGLDSVAIGFQRDYLNYSTGEVLFQNGDHLLVREAKRLKLLWRSLRDFDIVHFNFGRSIMPMSFIPGVSARSTFRFVRGNVIYDACLRIMEMRDLPILKWAGKGIVVTYQGDDARQGDYCREHFAISPVQEAGEDYYMPPSDARKRNAIAKMARYADRIYSLNPDLLHVLPPCAQFLPYANVDLSEWKPDDRERRNDVPIVLHAPSHRGVKGTRFILAAVDQLRTEGIKFEFVLVENLSNAEARQLYEQADLLVDQMLCGWYGGLAVELMALGKPVISYLREEDLKFIPAEMRAEIPIMNATPQTVYYVLKEYLTTRRHELPELGNRCRAYVEKWHDPVKIAAKLKQDYEEILASKSA
jgi:hypothetical protein